MSYKIYCEVSWEERKDCHWLDNGYCQYPERPEVEKREQLAKANGLEVLRGVCSQTREVA
jgi:hypothetical protein